MLKQTVTNSIARAGLCLLAGVLIPGWLVADNIYKYQDENGIWHFTDRAPDENVAFETVFMERNVEPRMQMRQEGTQRNPVYLVFNDFWGPAEIEMSLQDVVNIISEPPLPARFVLPGQKEELLVGLAALDTRKAFSYRIRMQYVPGRPMAEKINGLIVLPPFAPGTSHRISQAFQGGKTHTSADNEYAVDFNMPVGTPVHAARAGVVMDIEEDFNRGGTSKGFEDKANHVRILHEDGTMALYAHLDIASVFVRLGARVRAGQKIANSGNTGFSTGPHLHFVIQQNMGMKIESVPFRFQTPEGVAVTPEARTLLQGVRR